MPTTAANYSAILDLLDHKESHLILNPTNMSESRLIMLQV